MTAREYSELCSRLEGQTYDLTVNFNDLGLLLGGLRAVLDHPDAQGASRDFLVYMQELREGILHGYLELGLTPGQIVALDTMYASAAYEHSHDEAGQGTRDKSHLRILDSLEDLK